jgi:hypothetical protein
VHGTIDVPLEEFKNWAGGFDTVEAAATYATSAGIPLTLFTVIGPGGEIQTIRMEHVWVEAAIDYVPSRGARNYVADEWVELDPSYKQYEYSSSLDAEQISGLDYDQLVQSTIDTALINNQEGWMSGLDASVLNTPITQNQQALSDYVANNLPDPTLDQIVGGQKVIIKEYPVLPAELNNKIVEGARYDKIPAQLQQRVSFSFEKDIFGEPQNPITFSWPSLNNEKVTLSFRPATNADEQALAALADGATGPITSISSNLIQVVPELKVNGTVVKTGSAMKPGEELPFTTDITFVANGMAGGPRTYNVIAGSYLSVNVIAGSVSSEKIAETQNRLEQTKQILDFGDDALLDSLTREETAGDIYYTGTLGYYAQLIAQSYTRGIQFGAQTYLAAGYGTVGYEPNVSYFFGFPVAIEEGGLVFDIPVITVSAANNGDADKRVDFVFQTGLIGSELEHLVPEQIFRNSGLELDAISAVKALEKANALGQRIYRITQANRDSALPNIHHDGETMAEITAALNAGKVVITHTDSVSVPGGWVGAGYLILDPNTGDGAYKISGGQNGSFFYIGVVFGVLFALSLYAGFTKLGKPALAVAAGLAIAVLAVYHLYGLIYGEHAQQCFAQGVIGGLIIGAFAIGAINRLGGPSIPFAVEALLFAIGLGSLTVTTSPVQECT